ncbi:hypothetical protein GCM10009787_66810 [Streptomyces bangladeshensis]|uniref:Uncharacterized protein n=1 Tax=Streptomyces bangladeshensis TaxID=295352 RepID=A0ABP5NV90_9ACTN
MTALRPTGVSMHDLLASCEAAQAVSCPPRPPETRPKGARGTARATKTAPQPPDGVPRHPQQTA